MSDKPSDKDRAKEYEDAKKDMERRAAKSPKENPGGK